MITCDRAKVLLSDYIENELAPDIKQALESHLNICEGCKQVVANVKLISRKLNIITPINASSQFNQELRNKLINSTNSNQKESRFSIQKLSYGFSGVALAAALYFLIFTNFNITSSTQPALQSPNSPNPMSTQPALQRNSPALVTDQPDPNPSTIVTDTLKSEPESIDQNRIKLVDQE